MKQVPIRYVIYVLVLGLLIVIGLLWRTGPKPAQRENVETFTEKRISFLAVGDIMLSRGVARAIVRTDNPLTPFEKMESVFRFTDFNFGNLESPISGNNNILGKGLVFNMHERDVAGLKAFNFKVLNLANNHAMDQGLKGLQQTRTVLAANDLTFLGVGDDLDQAWQPKTIDVKGVKIGFVGASYASINDNGVTRNEYVARMEDKERLRRSIEQLRAEGADFIVATMHGGTEYTRRPNDTQVDFARAAIDFGADIVIGAHPHWVQVFEQYKGRYIFYSLGNFIFDQEWSRDTKEGLTLKITLHSRKSSLHASSASFTRIEHIELIPVVIENFSTPRPATEAESEQILKNIGATERIINP